MTTPVEPTKFWKTMIAIGVILMLLGPWICFSALVAPSAQGLPQAQQQVAFVGIFVILLSLFLIFAGTFGLIWNKKD